MSSTVLDNGENEEEEGKNKYSSCWEKSRQVVASSTAVDLTQDALAGNGIMRIQISRVPNTSAAISLMILA